MRIMHKDKEVLVGKLEPGPKALYKMDIQVASPSFKVVHAACSTGSLKALSWMDWHRILGHQNLQSVEAIIKQQELGQFHVNKSTNFFCEHCAQGKMVTVPFKNATTAKDIGEKVVINVWGPAQNHGLKKEKYFIAIVNMASQFKMIRHINNKNQGLSRVKGFVEFIAGLKHKVYRIQMDEGSEFQEI